MAIEFGGKQYFKDPAKFENDVRDFVGRFSYQGMYINNIYGMVEIRFSELSLAHVEIEFKPSLRQVFETDIWSRGNRFGIHDVYDLENCQVEKVTHLGNEDYKATLILQGYIRRLEVILENGKIKIEEGDVIKNYKMDVFFKTDVIISSFVTDSGGSEKLERAKLDFLDFTGFQPYLKVKDLTDAITQSSKIATTILVAVDGLTFLYDLFSSTRSKLKSNFGDLTKNLNSIKNQIKKETSKLPDGFESKAIANYIEKDYDLLQNEFQFFEKFFDGAGKRLDTRVNKAETLVKKMQRG